jgi:phosphate butyryltransferase
MITSFEELMAHAKAAPRQKVAIAAAADSDCLRVAEQAEDAGIATCLLVGDMARILEIAATENIRVNPANIVAAATDTEAARKAVMLVATGEADLLMKGMLQTGDFLRAVLNKETGLPRRRLLSVVQLYESPHGGLMYMSDPAMNIAPTLAEKKAIIENAIEVAHGLGNPLPKVAVLAALEIVNPDMKDTVEAGALGKMGDRGQFKGAIVDGPFAFDNAVSLEAAKHKGVVSPVAGQADILIVPDLNSGNILHKALVHIANLKAAAVVMGSDCPIIVNSRSDSAEAKLTSVALASYLTSVQRTKKGH